MEMKQGGTLLTILIIFCEIWNSYVIIMSIILLKIWLQYILLTQCFKLNIWVQLNPLPAVIFLNIILALLSVISHNNDWSPLNLIPEVIKWA